MSEAASFNREQAIRIEQHITLQYSFAAGVHATRFFEALSGFQSGLRADVPPLVGTARMLFPDE